MGTVILKEEVKVVKPVEVQITLNMEQAAYLAELCWVVLSAGLVRACGLDGFIDNPALETIRKGLGSDVPLFKSYPGNHHSTIALRK